MGRFEPMHTVPPRRLAAIFLPALAVLGVIAMLAVAGVVNVRALTEDVTAMARLRPWAGLLSNLGILLWWTAAAICFFGAAMVRRSGEPGAFAFLLSSGALSTYLTLDDLLQVHERLAPRYAGVAEEHVLAAIAIAAAAHVFAFRRLILRTDYRLLGLALALLGAAALMDSIFHSWLRTLGQWEFFIEDGAKWLGIVSWCAYHTSASAYLVRAAAAQPASRAPVPVVRWTPGEPAPQRTSARRRVGG